MKFEIIDNATYASNGILISYVFYIASAWIIGDAAFSDFILSTFISLVVGIVLSEGTRMLKMNIAGKMRLENKEVLKHLNQNELEKIMDYQNYLGLSIEKTEKIIQKWKNFN